MTHGAHISICDVNPETVWGDDAGARWNAVIASFSAQVAAVHKMDMNDRRRRPTTVLILAPAGWRHDVVQSQVHHHLPVDIHGVRHREVGDPRAGRLAHEPWTRNRLYPCRVVEFLEHRFAVVVRLPQRLMMSAFDVAFMIDRRRRCLARRACRAASG